MDREEFVEEVPDRHWPNDAFSRDSEIHFIPRSVERAVRMVVTGVPRCIHVIESEPIESEAKVHTFWGYTFRIARQTVGWPDDECGYAQMTVTLSYRGLSGTITRSLLLQAGDRQLPRARSD